MGTWEAAPPTSVRAVEPFAILTEADMAVVHYRPRSSFYTHGPKLSQLDLSAFNERLAMLCDEFGLQYGGEVAEVTEHVDEKDEVTYVEVA